MKRPLDNRRRIPSIKFYMIKPAWYRRHVVIAQVGSQHIPVMRSWSWDRADNLMFKLLEADYARRMRL